MNQEKIRVAVFNENCIRAGCRAWAEEEKGEPSRDVTVYEGNREAIRDHAADLFAFAEAGGHGDGHAAFLYRLVETLEDAAA